jgi:hypothetical protein
MLAQPMPPAQLARSQLIVVLRLPQRSEPMARTRIHRAADSTARNQRRWRSPDSACFPRLVCSQDIDDLSGPAGADLRTDDWELAGFAAADAVLPGSPAASVTAVCSDTDERHWLQPRTRETA